MIEVWLWIILLAIASVRALTTAVSKTYEMSVDGLDEYEQLIFKEDAEHWWMAVLINVLLLSIGVVQLVAPPIPPGVADYMDTLDLPWHYSYSTVVSVIFAILLNVRIERHGWYSRKRQGVNIFGRPRSEPLTTSAKRFFRRHILRKR